jgi:4'-phosphopantetheinyl transferase
VTSRGLGWLSCSLADVPDDDVWLTPREHATLSELRFAPRRDDWRLGRWTAKQAVRAWLDMNSGVSSHETLEIIAADDGAPEAFLAGRAAPVAVSLSHREQLAVCVVALAGTRVGCDLEAVEPRSDLFVGDWFTPEERAVVDAASAGARSLVTALIWSGKESALKALREGLRLDTRDAVVRLGPSFDHCGHEGWAPFSVVLADQRCSFAGRWRRHLGDVITIVAPAPWRSDPVALVPRCRPEMKSG